MAKQPYIQFYLGDYIKDTRVLPLNVKGGWVDLILAMWDNEPKGELIGTIEDFARIMNCSKDEANLVIQTLKQKKIFDYSDFGTSGEMKIASRKQKKMIELSKKRKDAGNQGGNPILVKQKDKLITEYENEIVNEDVFKDRGMGKGFLFPDEKFQLELSEMDIGRAVQYITFTKHVEANNETVQALWGVFKTKNFTGKKPYKDKSDIIRHFFESLKFQQINGKPKNSRVVGKDPVTDKL